MRCKHDWEVVVDKVLPSGVEEAQKHGIIRMKSAPGDFFRKTSITILKCKLCGKLDKTVERS